MISVSHLTALDATPEDFLEGAAAAGFDGVGLRIIPPKHTPSQWPVVGDWHRIKALRRQADDLGIRIFEAESFMMEAEVDMGALRRGLEAAAELGVSCLVSAGADPDESRLVAGYAALGEAAAEFGIVAGMEFMAFRPMRSLADAVRVWRKVGHPNARLLIDALHLDRSGGTPEDVGALGPNMIGYIHICDAPGARPTDLSLADEARTGRLYPGDGKLPLHRLFDVLPEGVPVSLEAPVGGYAPLPPKERLRIAGERTLGFFEERQRRRAELTPAGS